MAMQRGPSRCSTAGSGGRCAATPLKTPMRTSPAARWASSAAPTSLLQSTRASHGILAGRTLRCCLPCLYLAVGGVVDTAAWHMFGRCIRVHLGACRRAKLEWRLSCGRRYTFATNSACAAPEFAITGHFKEQWLGLLSKEQWYAWLGRSCLLT